MLRPIRIESTIPPQPFNNLGSGYWYYNYDVQSNRIIVPPLKGTDKAKEEIRYNYIQIKMYGKPDYKRCVESIIRKFITQSQEFDLINSANKAILNGDTNDEGIARYKEYLSKIEEIKQKVAMDFKK